jgi:DNA repair exonuclease SbcCD ATPase subunit
MCFDKAYIDFTQFSAALIVGKKESNEHYSNGVGKTSIFKAIEYCLFNEADVNLQRIILDDANMCQVVLDFSILNEEYRLSRKRTQKGVSDLTFLQRTTQPGTEEEAYHKILNDNYIPYLDKLEIEKYWKDLSGSRATDTERDLTKLIKYNHKSFRSTVHFVQNDIGGLTTATAEKRKGILKDALNLMVYAKLEKIAKEKSNQLTKEIEKSQIIMDGLGEPEKELVSLAASLIEIEKSLVEKNSQFFMLNEEIAGYNSIIAQLTHNHSQLEAKFVSLLQQEKSIGSEISNTEISIKVYTEKSASIVQMANNLINEIKAAKENQIKLANLNYDSIETLTKQLEEKKEEVYKNNLNIKSSMEQYEDLKIPLPNGSVCKNCRKPMTDSERKSCQDHINQDMISLQENIKQSKIIIAKLNPEIAQHQKDIANLQTSKQNLNKITDQLLNLEKDVQDKKTTHKEYATLISSFKSNLKDKTKELQDIKAELKNSSLEEANIIKAQIESGKAKIANLSPVISLLNKEITHYNNSQAIAKHSIEQKTSDKLKKEQLKQNLLILQNKAIKYPAVIQGFSSAGIPNLIIQDVLDDLQIESNNLLNLLKPGLQLSFLIEKTTTKDEIADTLDIKYNINGKERYYEQLSGAMRLAVSFSLKLGLSFVLQKRLGVDIKFLLLDEIDQSLDKASVDAFAEIIKAFQQDFTILVITHNDQLKEKFKHIILVEQDINMISTAKVVSS